MSNCKLVGCEEVVGPERGASLFCTDGHRLVAHHNSITRRRAKRADREFAWCDVPGCLKIYVIIDNYTCICPGCSRAGYTLIKGKYIKIVKFDRSISSPQDFTDFRATICKKDERDCIHYQDCSDSVMDNKHGGFKYQLNGNIDCYEAPKIRLASGYNSIAACSINDRCR